MIPGVKVMAGGSDDAIGRQSEELERGAAMIVRGYRRGGAVGGAMALAVGLAWLALTAPAVADDSDWQGELQRQLKEEYNCDVAYLSRMEKRNVEGREIIFVRAHCFDQRSFDATRQGEAERFVIKSCEVQAC